MARGRSKLEDRPKARSFASLGQLRHYLTPYKWSILGAFIALCFTSGSVLGMGYGLRHMVDEGLGKGDPALLNQALFVMLGVVVLLAIATYVRYSLVTWVGERVIADIRRDVYDHVIRMHIGFFETTRTGEILSRLTTDTTLLQSVVGSSVSVALRNILMFIGALVMLFVTSPMLTLYIAFIVPLVVVPIITLGRKVRKLSRESQDRLADLSSQIEESVSAIRAIQALSLEKAREAQFDAQVDVLLATAKRRITTRAILTAIVIMLVFGAIITVLWVGGRGVVEGSLSAGALSAFIFYSVVLAGAVGAISEVVGDLQRAAGATERLMELLATPAEISAPAVPLPVPSPLEGRITFEHVDFHYPSRPNQAALKDFSLSVEPGEMIALVGPSGAGKSTIFQLLLRFYDPQSGHIRLDGVETREFAPEALRGAVGLVSQDPVVFSANAWDNIRSGRTDATDAEVLEAARAAAALEFLEALPEGLDSFLGEKGVRLSGGQRQRVAIARAMVRNPRVLLLDEATNSLDAQSERLVQEAITRLMQGRTTLVIAHRLSTVLNADKIVVMDNGGISAIGTHKELLLSSPLYKRLAELQFEVA